ncbi:CCA tRNA nucleotidyltransferase [Falsiroseomonas stagni]|uniref:Poly(A) polymerase n=1 Tax=Falsiroseomonas stagni DSM 19981 TaxID=1123062 RepID=A0A1I4E8D5_9PROT|nr:CCA tRNA nucleotidyltransferase [Falsiroseomonas stagni]SFL00451.1 poly(A) polymerase [Falsiroseomonas stagni DSM 19981]
MTDAPQGRIPPPPFLAEPAPAAVLAALPGSRAVGGCVRDALAGVAVHDVDVAAPLPPADIAERLKAAGLKVFETGLAHGTVTAVLGGQAVEVTALRRDVATDGRHAEVAWTTDWAEDAARRDFTINAMSCDGEGRLWDYFGGREDLAAGRVRFVGDAATRLAEDFLRALRFFRFWARYGRGAPDAAAVAAIRGAVEGLARRIAVERIWMELKRLLEAADPVGALLLMEETGIRAAALPEGADPATLAAGLARGLPRDPVLRLAVLVPDGAADARLPSRLRWSREEAGQYAAARATARVRGALDDAALRRLLADVPLARLLDASWVAESRGEAGDWPGLRARLAAIPVPVFPLRGQDAIDLGHKPDARIGQAMKAVRAWWIEGGCVADRTASLARFAAELERSGAADGPTAPGRKNPGS